MTELDFLLGSCPEIDATKIRYVIRQAKKCNDSEQVDSTLKMLENVKSSYNKKVIKKCSGLFDYVIDLIIEQRSEVVIIEI